MTNTRKCAKNKKEKLQKQKKYARQNWGSKLYINSFENSVADGFPMFCLMMEKNKTMNTTGESIIIHNLQLHYKPQKENP